MTAGGQSCIEVLFLASCGIPGSGVFPSVITVEDKFGAGTGGATAYKLTGVTQGDTAVCRAVELYVYVTIPVGNLLQTDSFAVQCQAYGIKDDALARTGWTTDKE